MGLRRRLVVAILGAAAVLGWASAISAQAALSSPEGQDLVERLRTGGLVMFIRHADTSGERCDVGTGRVGDRESQRNISQAGREQSAALGERIRSLGIPVSEPVHASPVFRGRDTAELAFGPDAVEVTDGLLADDYAGERLSQVLDEHRRLFGEPVETGTNRVLVGHRGPVQMILGDAVAGTRLPEAGVLILDPREDGTVEMLGVVEIVPVINGGDPQCSWGG